MQARRQQIYLWLTGIFVAALVIADIMGGRVFRVGSVDLSSGMIAFPITFLLTDLLNEFYGPEGARRVTFVGLGAAVFVFLVILVALKLPTSPESVVNDEAFRSVFGWSWRVYVASLTAYVIGQLLDITIFQFFRRLTRHKLLWLRATGSTLVSQAVDTLVVTSVLFWGAKPLGFILTLSRNQYALKVLIAVFLTPVIYALHRFMLRSLHVGEPPEPKPLA